MRRLQHRVDRVRGVTAMATFTFVTVATGAEKAPAAAPTAAKREEASRKEPVRKEPGLKEVVQQNPYVFIPPQCYTKTRDDAGKVHNPCFSCHVASQAPNFIDDGALQLGYDFVPAARINRWTNLFVDWSAAGASISDAEILAYVRESNYFDAKGGIILAQSLVPPPPAWDYRDDKRWSGYVPDAYFHFDTSGFDRKPDGGYTGWRAYGYYPLPGTFWPTNGSAGDVLIRLAPSFRRNTKGEESLPVYQLNLALVEAAILRRSVAIEPVAEGEFGVDLDGDGRLGTARWVHFGEHAEFVGEARAEQGAGRVHWAPGLFPENTEFLHSVRYLDAAGGAVRMAARMKELRYARKADWVAPAQLEHRAREEALEKADSPNELRAMGGDLERGVYNSQGWWYQGFIEDERGALRPQSFEESAYCVGCHGGVGRGDDGIFSFSRRFDAATFQRGWFHWSQRGFDGVPDRLLDGGKRSEYVTYLEQNGAADEFRQNTEAAAAFLNSSGQLLPAARVKLQRNIAALLLPTEGRALSLDKAYRALVVTQTFTKGREIVLGGAHAVHQYVPAKESTGVSTALSASGGVVPASEKTSLAR
jgi:hypothetical protein